MFATKFARVAIERSLDPGHRIYAVGDVHGRLDLVDDLLARIRADSDARGAAAVLVVFLGDLIDRGPQSAGVVERLIGGLGWARLVCLRGNHEASMLDALDGDLDAARLWLLHGGRDALASWGIAEDFLLNNDPETIIAAARPLLPRAHVAWLRGLPVSLRMGDYYFVHAGVRPGVPLDRQSVHDQVWIRGGFLDSRAEHGVLVIHGHTISAKVDERSNRIGIDTGAYRSGRLTAIGIEGPDHWYVETEPGAG